MVSLFLKKEKKDIIASVDSSQNYHSFAKWTGNFSGAFSFYWSNKVLTIMSCFCFVMVAHNAIEYI